MSKSGSQLALWRMRSEFLYYRKHHGIRHGCAKEMEELVASLACLEELFRSERDWQTEESQDPGAALAGSASLARYRGRARLAAETVVSTMFDNLREDWRTYEGALSRQGLWVMVVYRFGRWRYTSAAATRCAYPSPSVYRILKLMSQILTGIDLPCEATVGRRFCIEHFGGIIISGDAVFGDDCVIRNGVTVGLRRTKSGAPPCLATAWISAQAPLSWANPDRGRREHRRQCGGAARCSFQFHCRRRSRDNSPQARHFPGTINANETRIDLRLRRWFCFARLRLPKRSNRTRTSSYVPRKTRMTPEEMIQGL